MAGPGPSARREYSNPLAARLFCPSGVIAEHGIDAVTAYVGNPAAHTFSIATPVSTQA